MPVMRSNSWIPSVFNDLFDTDFMPKANCTGKFLVAFKPKSSTDNEHNTIILKDKKGREILVRQIAGFVARRIVCDLQPGDEAVVGEELGMIRFGSRVDVFLPLDAEVNVKMGDKTYGKVTILAKLK